jgi:Tol biopolymer transport system component
LGTIRVSDGVVTPDGSLYYGRGEVYASEVYVAPVDAKAGHAEPGMPAVTRSNRGRNSLPSWSPDGRLLAYAARAQSDLSEVYFTEITFISLDGGSERSIRMDLQDDFRGPFGWSRDGRFLFAHGRTNGPGHGIYRIDSRSGATTPLFTKGATVVSEPVAMADGVSILYILDSRVVMLRNLDTGDEQMVCNPGPRVQISSLALSPDGRRIAFRGFDRTAKTARVMSASLSDKQILDVAPYQPSDGNAIQPAMAGAVAWSSDGRHLYFVDRTGRDGRDEIWRVPSEGGPAERTGLEMKNLSGIRVSPDGRRLAFDTLEYSAGGKFVFDKLFAR